MQDADNDNSETPMAEGTEPPRKMLSPAARRAPLPKPRSGERARSRWNYRRRSAAAAEPSRRASAITKSMAERLISKSIFQLASYDRNSRESG
ncbi:hypothetical protein ACVIEM_000447 [Rhizobium leguminosarum]